MKLAPIVLLLRASGTVFGDHIAGAAEFSAVKADTLEEDTAYVLPIPEVALPNTTDGEVIQKLLEGFGVVVAIRNDTSQADKTGILAYDRLNDIRTQLFGTLIGLNLGPALDSTVDDSYQVLTPVIFKGASPIGFNSAWLWYLYEFEFTAEISETPKELNLDDLNTISAQWVLTPSAQIPKTGAEPLPGDINADMESIIDFTENLLAGGFSKGFSSGFNLQKEEL